MTRHENSKTPIAHGFRGFLSVCATLFAMRPNTQPIYNPIVPPRAYVQRVNDNFGPSGAQPEAVVERAGQTLYRAKANGRNQVALDTKSGAS